MARRLSAGTLGYTLGLNIHILENRQAELDLIRKAGFRFLRVDLNWQRIEQQASVYDFSYYDPIIKDITEGGFRIIFILAYSNTLYENQVKVGPFWKSSFRTAAPTSEKAKQAFLDFVQAAVIKYGALDPIWEIWNEPDQIFWAPEPNLDAYLLLAKATCKVIRKIDITATVLAPAASLLPRPGALAPPFLAGVIGSDLLNCIDAVSVHPYLHIDELDWTPQLWQAIKRLPRRVEVDAVLPAPPTFVSTEWGLSTYRSGITDETQAAYLVKMVMLNLASNIPLSVIYSWRDAGDDPANPEHRYGITRRDGSAKPSYFALRHLVRQVGDMHFTCRVDWPRAIGLVFQDFASGDAVLATWPRPGRREWSATSNDRVEIQQLIPALSASDAMGSTAAVDFFPDKTTVGPGIQPFFIRLRSGDGVTAICR
ncbi:cellulase family glycosylhydrolase [Xanthobacter sp. KR7-65]|uniref:cellulase family glycosylhydrolase n=1 Tax=Xanthobacter sp. KR7-65 TaxID=3156612 RepID=UPI0032B4DE2E